MNRIQDIQSSDGVRLRANVHGTGKEVIIVPNGIYMEPDFSWLGTKYTVVFYDLRNRGHSESPASAKLERGVRHDVDDLETVRRQLSVERVHVLGHSYLGLVVALYAMQYPGRVHRVVQIGPAPANMAKQYPPHLTHTDDVTREVFAALGHLQAQRQGRDPVEFCTAAWSHMRRMYVVDSADTDKIAQWGFCELENERNMLAHFNANILPSLKALNLSATDYAKVTAPVLTIHGTKDRNAPFGGGRDWALSLPNARLIAVDNAAHVPWIEAPALVFDSIKVFLNGNWPEQAKSVTLDT